MSYLRLPTGVIAPGEYPQAVPNRQHDDDANNVRLPRQLQGQREQSHRLIGPVGAAGDDVPIRIDLQHLSPFATGTSQDQPHDAPDQACKEGQEGV